MAKLTIKPVTSREVFERDNRGETVYPDKSKKTCALIECSIESVKGEISFNIVVQFPKSIIAEGSNVEQLAIAWAIQNIPIDLAESGYWNYFETMRFDVREAPSIEVEHDSSPIVRELQMSERAETNLDNALTHLVGVREKFDLALGILSKYVAENAPYGFKLTLAEARQHFRTLEAILDCSGQQGGYAAHDVRGAFRDYEELARRQVVNNHNYQSALRDVQRVVYRLSFPRTWGRKPSA
ncbi:hypothetical protein [Algiphilus sp.]|uniref:hypothetical protein n=1 Tax=Algiphilus sp. TaxID=1872431 RepID=UPI0032EF3B8E